ncbi:delta subunit of the central stalk of mitochondrial F1F0 ATP synthase, atp16 [Thoreauomyces humboldtii]|nr:delta subunit of the central stalk of mitochondrial F1F0 ATP synthase, atp16 [Thoreauomyces humboldtii]
MFRNAIRAVRPVARASLARAYATEAAGPAKLRVSFVVPHQTILNNVEATQVNLSSSEGDMGILAEHVPTVAQLKAGTIEVFSPAGNKKFFASGGFAIINPDSTLNINAVEAFPLEEIDAEAVRRGADDANRRTSTGSEADRLIAKVELEVYEALAAAVGK